MSPKHVLLLAIACLPPAVMLTDLHFLEHRVELVRINDVVIRSSSVHYRRFEYTALELDDGRRLQLDKRRPFSAGEYLLVSRSVLMRLLVRVESFGAVGPTGNERLTTILSWMAILVIGLNIAFMLARLPLMMLVSQAVLLSVAWIQAGTLAG